MKILHIVPTYVPAFRHGGPIKSVHALNKWLVRLGVEVTVYTTDIHGKERLRVPVGVPVDVDGVKVFYFRSSFPRAWSYSRGLHQAIRGHVQEFDLVHITSVFLAVSTLGAYYARKHKKPYIISPRGSLISDLVSKKNTLLKRLYISLIEKRNLAGAAAIHFTARAEEEDYITSGLPFLRQDFQPLSLLRRDPRPRGFVVPNSIDEEEFEMPRDLTEEQVRDKFGIPRGVPVVLSFGRVHWKKGLDVLIPAFKEVLVREPEAFLVIGGNDDGYAAQARRLVSEHGIDDHVRFTGMVIGQERTLLFRTAKVFALPSISENFGMVVAEAMFCSTAVVISPGVAIAREVEASKAGVVVERDVNKLAFAIVRVLEDEVLRRELTENALAFARLHYASKGVAEAFMREYVRILNIV